MVIREGKIVELAKLDNYGKKRIASSKNLNDLDMIKVRDIIESYHRFIDGLQYPLTEAEHDLKYQTIGMYIRYEMENVEVMIDKGIHVKIDEHRAIYINKQDWILYDISDSSFKENLGENIEEFKGEVGYREYKWVLDRLRKGLGLENFYEVFEKDLYEKVKSVSKVERVLRRLYSKEVKGLKLPNNCIYVKDIDTIYNLDIVLEDRASLKTGESYINSETGRVEKEVVDRNIFDFRFREVVLGGYKEIENEECITRYGCIIGLCDYLSEEYNDCMYNVTLRGFIHNGEFVVEINGEVYSTNAYSDGQLEMIGTGRLLNIENEMVYVESADKSSIYAYNTEKRCISTMYIN